MGYKKLMMDSGQAGMLQTMFQGGDLPESGQVMDAVREVGPGKHFLGCARTQANFQYEPPPIDRAVDKAPLDFMARRKASFPDAHV